MFAFFFVLFCRFLDFTSPFPPRWATVLVLVHVCISIDFMLTSKPQWPLSILLALLSYRPCGLCRLHRRRDRRRSPPAPRQSPATPLSLA